MTPFSEWQNFYVIMGSAAGGLTGLQFVVMALIADMPIAADEMQTAQAFATPTVVHFGSVLTLAAVLVAPWQSVSAPAVLWGLLGLAGLTYTLVIAWRVRAQTAYKPVFEDWLFHTVLPVLAYGVLAGSVYAARFTVRKALFAIAGAALLLLFIGLHNAWDNVTYLVFRKKRELQ